MSDYFNSFTTQLGRLSSNLLSLTPEQVLTLVPDNSIKLFSGSVGYKTAITKSIPLLTLKNIKSLKESDAVRRIWVTFSREGIHKYPAAYSDPKLATGDEFDVSFLSHPHRHIFNFKVWITVNHNDRDIEFIQFKRWLESLYKKETLQLNNKSCEMIADDLYAQINLKYPGRQVKIQVDEDGENGCEIEYNF